MKTLHNWRIQRDGSPYRAPELCGKYLRADHPDIEGKDISTSCIAAADGRVLTTVSGSKYKLGRIHPKYRKWLRDNGIEYRPTQPVVIR